MRLPDAFFVTGTDTGVGKTLVCAILLAASKGTYWKPIQSGAKDGTDTLWIKEATGYGEHHFLEEKYVLSQPLSPHAAAEIDKVAIDINTITVPKPAHKPLIVEGAGGVMVPLSKMHLMQDLISSLRLPVIVVARSGLGTINHTLLSLGALRQKHVPILGVVLNGPPNASNRAAIEYYGDAAILAEVPPLEKITPESLKQAASHFKGIEF